MGVGTFDVKRTYNELALRGPKFIEGAAGTALRLRPRLAGHIYLGERNTDDGVETVKKIRKWVGRHIYIFPMHGYRSPGKPGLSPNPI